MYTLREKKYRERERERETIQKEREESSMNGFKFKGWYFSFLEKQRRY